MKNIKQKLSSAKQKVVDNKTQIMGTALVITTATAVLMTRNKIVADNYLKEKGLYEDFYALTDED